MKILLVNAYAIPPSQAGGTRHFTLAKHLVKQGHEVKIFAGTEGLAMSRAADRPKLVDGVAFEWIPVPSYSGNGLSRVKNMLAFRKGIQGAAKEKPDLIVGSSPHLLAAQGAAKAAKRFGVPFILEVRDIWPQTLVDMGVSRKHPFVLWQARIEAQLYREAKGIVTLLPESEAYFRGKGFQGPVLILPNGIDLELAPEVQPEPESPFEVLYAGAHGAANGLGIILQVAQALPDIQFTLVGDGPAKAELKRQGSGIPNVRFEDPVPKSEIFHRLAKAHVLLHVLTDAKVFSHGVSPNKMFDYMAVGRPVVVSASVVGSPVQLAESGIQTPAGDVEALAEAIRSLQNQGPDARRALGQRGRQYVADRHDLKAGAARLADFLAGLSN